MGLNYNLLAVFVDPFVNQIRFTLVDAQRVILKVPLELLSLYNGRWSPLVEGNRKMAARTLPLASLPSGSLERHELSSHYIDQWCGLNISI